MKYIVNVTQADIDAGKELDCEACPIALAVSRATGRKMVVARGEVAQCGGSWEVKLPRIAVNFVDRFDAGERVVPFSFVIDLPIEHNGFPKMPEPAEARR